MLTIFTIMLILYAHKMLLLCSKSPTIMLRFFPRITHFLPKIQYNCLIVGVRAAKFTFAKFVSFQCNNVSAVLVILLDMMLFSKSYRQSRLPTLKTRIIVFFVSLEFNCISLLSCLSTLSQYPCSVYLHRTH